MRLKISYSHCKVFKYFESAIETPFKTCFWKIYSNKIGLKKTQKISCKYCIINSVHQFNEPKLSSRSINRYFL